MGSFFRSKAATEHLACWRTRPAVTPGDGNMYRRTPRVSSQSSSSSTKLLEDLCSLIPQLCSISCVKLEPEVSPLVVLTSALRKWGWDPTRFGLLLLGHGYGLKLSWTHVMRGQRYINAIIWFQNAIPACPNYLIKIKKWQTCMICFPSFISVASQQIPELILWTFIAHATRGNTPLTFDIIWQSLNLRPTEIQCRFWFCMLNMSND